MVKELWKTKKTQGFFGFSLHSQKETKATNIQKPKKTLSFFGFSQFLNHQFIQKTKKTWVFSVVSRSKPKNKTKNPGKTKKPNMSLRPNILWKVLVFCFFGFLEVFLILSIEFPQRVSKYCFLLVFSRLFDFLGFPFGFSPK